MGLPIDDFRTLTPDKIDNQLTPDKSNSSQDSMDQSPAGTVYKPHSKDHAKPLPIAKIISTIQHLPKKNPTAPYMSAERYTAAVSSTSTNYKI